MRFCSVQYMGAFTVGVPQHEPWHLFVRVLVKTQQNECFEMLNNERGICMFMLSINKCYNEWIKSIEQILNAMFKYKLERNVGLQDISTNDILSLGVPNPIENIMSYFYTHVSYTFLQTLGMKICN
jgi:hypothetical protein